MTVLITGVSYDNRGAELLLHAAAAQVRTWQPPRRPVVTWRCGTLAQRRASGVGTHVSVLQAGALHHAGLNALPRQARERLEVSTDDDLEGILDASGFVLSDQWGVVPAQRLLRRVRSWTERGLPIILLPQAFGPFQSPEVAAVAREIVTASRLVYARDAESLRHLQELRLPADVAGRIRLAPDITIGLHEDAEVTEVGDTAVVPNWNIARRAPSARDRAAYLESLTRTVAAVRDIGGTPYGLCHEGDDDLALLEELSGNVGGLPILSGLSGPRCKALIAGSAGVVSGRFHACVSGLATGVPTVLHGWSHKYRELAQDFDSADNVADPYDPEATALTVKRVLASDGSASAAAADRHTESLKGLWAEVHTLLRPP